MCSQDIVNEEEIDFSWENSFNKNFIPWIASSGSLSVGFRHFTLTCEGWALEQRERKEGLLSSFSQRHLRQMSVLLPDIHRITCELQAPISSLRNDKLFSAKDPQLLVGALSVSLSQSISISDESHWNEIRFLKIKITMTFKVSNLHYIEFITELYLW